MSASERLGDVGQHPGRLGMVAPRCYDEELPGGHRLGKKQQHPQGSRIGPVQVLQDQHDRSRARRVHDGSDDFASHGEGPVIVVDLGERDVECRQDRPPRP